MRRTKDGILTKGQAVLVSSLTGVFYLLILALFDHADGEPWGQSLRSNIFDAVFLTVWMSVFFYYWPRWMAKRKKSV